MKIIDTEKSLRLCGESHLIGGSLSNYSPPCFAPWGARLAHQLSETVLRRIFAVFLAAIGRYMLLG